MRQIWLVLLQDFSLYDAAMTLHAFSGANDVLSESGLTPKYDTRLFAVGGGCVSGTPGAYLKSAALPPTARPPPGKGTLIVLGGPSRQLRSRADGTGKLAAWISKNHSKFPRLAAIGSEAQCAMRAVGAQPSAAPKQGFFAAAASSANALALRLIAHDLGHRCAEQVARKLSPYTDGQGTVVIVPMVSERVDSQDERVQALNRWVERHMRENLNVECLAQRLCMTPRTFARYYRRATGLTPARAVEQIRLSYATKAVASTPLSFKAIATRCGFSSEEVMRRSFMRVLQLSPTEYRQLMGQRP